jgi:chemotaxis protein MotA
MDLATIAGLLIAFTFIALSISDPGAFIEASSLMIVLGGSTAVVLYRSSLGEFLGAIKVAGKAFKNSLDEPKALIEQLVEMATIARKDGMIALEGQEIANPFLAKAVGMLVDGQDEAVIKASLEREKDETRARHTMGAKIFSAWGEIAPAMGMIGTLIGLVQMLGNMDDPKSIGPAMAIALLTTLYGAILANVIMLPMAMKLENQADLEETNNELIIEGALFIQTGGNPRILSDFLSSFLKPAVRAQLLSSD